MQFEWKVGTCGNRCTHWSQKTSDYSARGKERGELYSVEQNFIEQLRQLIAAGLSSTMVVHLHFPGIGCWFKSNLRYKNAKTVSVIREKHLMLDTQVNQVQRSSQGDIGLY